MSTKISELLDRLRQIEEEIEQELRRRRAELHVDFEHRRIVFEREVLDAQRRFKTGLLKYLRDAELRNVVTAPVVYSVILPLLMLDAFVSIYQWVCFPLYGIPKVRRRDYLVFDRAHLAYLNLIEKLNCAYCSYANGLIAYVKEIVGRTEQYWCPIKHARRVRQSHPHYSAFVDYGDAAGFRREVQALRARLAKLDSQGKATGSDARP
jgi:hypothetical protein